MQVCIAICVMAVSFVGVRFFRRWALRHQIMDIPNHRSSHSQPTPRGGGIIIAGLVLAGGCILVTLPGQALLRPVFLEIGEAIRIVDLANNLIHLAGLEPGMDIPIVFTGLRPGEKITEELKLKEEGIKPHLP